MPISGKQKTVGIIALSAVFFILDRIAKWLFISDLRHAEYPIVPSFLSMRLSLNSGIAFSLPLDQRFVIALTCLIISLLAYFAWTLWQEDRWSEFAAVSLLIAGAYSNLLDRLIYGAVIDYVDVNRFSVFNLADALIFFAVVALAWLAWRQPQKQRR